MNMDTYTNVPLSWRIMFYLQSIVVLDMKINLK